MKMIGKKHAVEMICNAKGKFFTVGFVEKDGTKRVMHCQGNSTTAPNELGYIVVRDTKIKTETNKRNINAQTLYELTINKVTYKVK